MKFKKAIAIALIVGLCLGGLVGGVAGIIERNKDAKTPLNWCVEEIKRKDMFEENNITAYAYTGEEARNETQIEWDKTYFVEITYASSGGAWYERWLCGISHKRTVWRLLKEEQIIKIGCDLLLRREI